MVQDTMNNLLDYTFLIPQSIQSIRRRDSDKILGPVERTARRDDAWYGKPGRNACMLHIKKVPIGPFKIKSIRKSADADLTPSASCYAGEAVDGTDKPPC